MQLHCSGLTTSSHDSNGSQQGLSHDCEAADIVYGLCKAQHGSRSRHSTTSAAESTGHMCMHPVNDRLFMPEHMGCDQEQTKWLRDYQRARVCVSVGQQLGCCSSMRAYHVRACPADGLQH
jgi:hypothetical protein